MTLESQLRKIRELDPGCPLTEEQAHEFAKTLQEAARLHPDCLDFASLQDFVGEELFTISWKVDPASDAAKDPRVSNGTGAPKLVIRHRNRAQALIEAAQWFPEVVDETIQPFTFEQLELESFAREQLLRILEDLTLRYHGRIQAIELSEFADAVSARRWRTSWIPEKKIWQTFWGPTPETALLVGIRSFEAGQVARAVRLLKTAHFRGET
jgi:hypothetical protein